MKNLVLFLAVGCATSAQASGFKTLHAFTGQDGAYPSASLTVVGDQLYGTTEAGGPHSSGVLFTFTPKKRVYQVIHGFGGGNDGAQPDGALLLAKDGTLYGVTQQGGSIGAGTLYAVSQNKETVIYSFGSGTDGYSPEGNLLDIKGQLVGVATNGGSYMSGAVFAVSPGGSEQLLHSFGPFEAGTDGFFPFAGLRKVGGAFYGITAGGGANCGNPGCGTVFSMTPDGSESLVYSFGAGSTDASSPYGLLLKDGKTIYGTTLQGGTYGNGTVYAIHSDGTETILHSFGGPGDGSQPYGRVIKVRDVFYGTTYAGGKNGLGTVYAMTPQGHVKVLHAFAGGADGSQPVADLVEYNGVLYGTAQNGGNGYIGTIFSVTP